MYSWIGGKSRIAEKLIVPHIPWDIETYYESFGGAFWVWLKMKPSQYPKLRHVIYNDYNPLNANLWACIKNYETFYDYIKNIPAQEEDRFYEYHKSIFSEENKFENYQFDQNRPNFELGLRFIYVITQVFSGLNPEKANL